MFKILSDDGIWIVAQISPDNLQIRYLKATGPNWAELFMDRYAEDFRKAEQAYDWGER